MLQVKHVKRKEKIIASAYLIQNAEEPTLHPFNTQDIIVIV